MLNLFALDVKCPYSPEVLLKRAESDKKADGDGVSLVVPISMGECDIVKISMDEFLTILKDGIK